MTREELIVILKEELRGLALQFEVSDWDNAVDDALRETGWAFPTEVDFQIHWLKERSKRHLLSYLCDTSAYKFKYKAISLGDRFVHLFKRIQYLDELFAIAKEENFYAFTGVDEDSLPAGVNSFDLFPHKIDAGFASEPQTGKDLTYSENQEVMVSPNENS